MACFRRLHGTVALSLALALLGCSDDPAAPPTTAGSGGQGGAGPEPIEADEGVWTWVPIEGAICGNGTPTGIGVNLSSASSKVIIYLQGGGVCYDPTTCLGPDPTAANFDGFDTAEFEGFATGNGTRGPFARGDAANPFADYSYVFVPYCTGDVHAGNNVEGELHFVGQENVKRALERLVPTFPEPELVVLTGASAGGFGAMYDFYLVQTAFEPAPAVLVDDSGPFLPLDTIPQLAALEIFFNLQATIPPGCDACLDKDAPDAGLHRLIPYYAETFPGRRGSLVSSLQDDTIAQNFSMTGPELETALNQLADQTVPQNPDFRVFYLSGSHHVWLFGGDAGESLGDVVSGGVSLADFLRDQIEGAASWSDVRP